MPDPWEGDARALYEEATAKARRYTAAAWVRWEDVDADCRATWLTFAERKREKESLVRGGIEAEVLVGELPDRADGDAHVE